MALQGKLVGSDGGYTGHSVELETAFLLEGIEEEVTLLLRGEAADDGGFAIEFPEASEQRGPLRLTVRGPGGDKLLTETRSDASQPVELEVEAQAPIELEVEADPLDEALGEFSTRVRVTDSSLNAPAAGRLVSIWGEREPGNGGGNAAVRTILAAEYTDAVGTARLSYARAAYRSLELELAGSSADPPTPVPLDDERLPPEEMRVSASFPEAPESAAEDEACDCSDADLPRTPDQTELAEPGSLYSTDLADGTCPSPAVANRTLEEYRYYSLIRTTDPYLFGVKPKRPRPLSPGALEALAELAYGFGSMDATLTEPEVEPGSVGLVDDVAARPTGAVKLDAARQASEAYFSQGLVTARAWRETAKGDKLRQAILDRAQNLSEEALRHALADPDGFTPVALMTAERYDAIGQVKDKLRLFHDASKGRELVSTENMPQWDEPDGLYQAATVAHGHILEWRQVWRADGYSLGDLVYSLPLAPGQKRKVAVIDWDRDEGDFRTESRTFAEDFQADLTRDRTVTEVVNSTVNESIRAGSKTNTWAAGGGIGLGIPFSGGFFGLGVAGGGGGASSSAWQNSARALSASSGQHLSDRTSQAAAAVRSQRASVVVGAQQRESLAITSEVVANYNHCHAMTVEYFEVLQHFRVDQELANVRESLFIPLAMRPFTMWKAHRWRDILRRRLRRRRWVRGFGAIERILQGYHDSGLPPGRYADEPITELSGELRLELSIARPRDPREDEDIDTYLDTAWDFWKELFGADSAKKAYDETIDSRDLAEEIFADQYAPRVARAFCESLDVTLVVEDPVTGTTSDETLECDFTMVSNYRPGGLHLVSFRAKKVPSNISRARIRAIRFGSNLDSLSPNSTTVLRMANVQYATEYRRHRLVPNRWMRNDLLDGDAALVSTRNLTRSEERNPREEDREARTGLLKHLNEFVEHYHQVIWWRMDPNRRFMLLDGFFAPNSGGRSLASVVENRLISIVGNALVMPVAPGYHLDPLIRASLEEKEPLDLLELYRPPIPSVPKRLSLPTRGVHAEAILGECNSCEIRDDTRFWDWASEPIPGNEPPEIAEISTASRRQTPADTTPSELPNPVVAIQNAPAAPDPTSIGALAGLLGQENLFKDITGLEANQLNAIAAFQQSLKTANAFGKMAASGAKSSFANRSSDRVLRKVKEAESSGLLQKDDAKDVVGRLFGVINGEQTDTDKPLSEDKTVKSALESTTQAPGKKKVKVSSDTGSTSQSVEATFSTPEGAARVAFDTRITGIPPLQQPSPLSCWAVSLAMLKSHQLQQSLPVETVLLEGGQQYVDLFRADSGLQLPQVPAFRDDFGLRDVSFGALSAASVAAALDQHGPLWVIADEDSSPGFSIHARVVTGIVGDGTPQGTKIIFNDPATGEEDDESLKVFADKLDQLSDGARSAFGGVSPMVLAV